MGLIVLSMIALFFCMYLMYNENLPDGEQSEAADELAKKMLKAINHESYKETRFLEWTMAGRNHYKWDKFEQVVDVAWGRYVVHLNTRDPKLSTAQIDGEIIDDASKMEVIEKAVASFNNDSFWLVAPHKAFDPGTERRIVMLENGAQGLLVTYTSGGNTPGDSYLWILEDSGLPRAFKLWVSIFPIGGLEATWEGWKTTESGALLPTRHSLLFLEFEMSNMRGWNEEN